MDIEKNRIREEIKAQMAKEEEEKARLEAMNIQTQEELSEEAPILE